MTGICGVMIAVTIGTSSVWAAKKKAAPETPLTESGQKLQERYAAMLTELQAEISKAVPAVDEQKKAAYLKAREAEKAAEAEVKAAQQRLGKIATAQALVNHAKGKWIGGAEKGIATAQTTLKNATTEAERNAAQKDLVRWQKNREDGTKALKERQEALDKVKREEPRLVRELEAAKKAFTRAQAGMMKTVKDLNLESSLSSDKLDAKLAKYVVLLEATPRGLAAFAQQGKANRMIVVGKDGVITIPAVACSKPTNSTAKIKFMKSNLGGMQLHYGRLGKHEEFEYTFDAPKAGKYTLTARVVTPSWRQHLLVTANGAEKPTGIALPFTVGMWDKTQPVMVPLVKGRNVLRFSRNEPVKGLTIKDFTLRPVK